MEACSTSVSSTVAAVEVLQSRRSRLSDSRLEGVLLLAKLLRRERSSWNLEASAVISSVCETLHPVSARSCPSTHLGCKKGRKRRDWALEKQIKARSQVGRKVAAPRLHSAADLLCAVPESAMPNGDHGQRSDSSERSAVHRPNHAAVNPDPDWPSSLETPMKIMSTALTRPRISSGVASCTRVPEQSR